MGLRSNSRVNRRRHRVIETLEKRVLLAGDLVGHWRADDLNAVVDDQAVVSTWTDVVGGVEASRTGTPVLAKGSVGGRSAVRFENSDGPDGLMIPSSISPLLDETDFSVVATFATSSTDLVGGTAAWLNNSGLVDANNLNFGQDWGLTMNPDGALSVGMGLGAPFASTTAYSDVSGLNDGQFHVATLTRDGANMMIYVDGALVGSLSNGVDTMLSPNDIFIGRTNAGKHGFDGDIADVRLYDGALSEQEVLSVYGELNSYFNNSPPTANPDEYTFAEDVSVLFALVTADRGVLSNDVDPDGDPLTAVLVDTAQHGVLTLNPNGSFSYDSDENFSGVDSFTYRARDFQDSEVTLVTINVTPVYDPPIATPDRYKLLSGDVLSVSSLVGVLENDINVDGATLKAVLSRDVDHGQLALAEDGGLTFDPQGFAGVATFEYRIDDGSQLSSPIEVSIVVNSPPTANDDSFVINEDEVYTTTVANGVLANDVDAEGDNLVVSLVESTQHGTLKLNPDGSFSYQSQANYSGSDSFAYQLSDGEDSSAIATVNLEVRAVNDAPAAEDDVYFALANETLEVSVLAGVLANDSDIEDGELSAVLATPPAQGTLTLQSDGSFTYQPVADTTGVVEFTYQTSDGQDLSAPATVRVAINSLEQQQQIIINEVHVDPPQKTELVEFIELFNKGDAPIDMSGWTLRNAVDYAFPEGASIPSGGYLVVTMNPEMFTDKFSKPAIGPWEGRLANSGETIELWTAGGAQVDEVDYQLGFPWPTYGEDDGRSIQLIEPSMQNDLGGNWRSAKPTPAAKNSVYADNAAPQMRRVEHSPTSPTSADDVTITARVTDPDGVLSVMLEYQLVNPGDYIGLSDNRYKTDWTSVEMRDDGQNGDVEGFDGVYTAVMPAELQSHRRLVRYRLTATDTKGAAIRAPYEDDLQPNFAYFVYDGVPDWTASDRPGSKPEVTYTGDVLNSIPVYQLITTRQSHIDSQYIPDSTRRGGYGGSDYLWEGTMVYDGVVYDHINYRARGGVWRYAMGKNMWKFDFNRGHRFQARDNYGNEYSELWDKINFSSVIQQGDFRHRGEQGLFESVGFKLYNLAGTESPNTNYVHFRIVESENENGADQYKGDFQGLYLAIEQPDGNFLDEHGLPDGNFYKIEGNNPESVTNQGPYQVDDRSDARSFIRSFRGNSRPDVQWWQENLNLEKYYGYQAISHAIHHYDTAFGKNFFYYNNPETGRWEIHPWDLDLTWANNMYGNENHEFNTRVAKNDDFNEYVNQANMDSRNRLNRYYQNRSREILDLLYNQEQTGMLIDEMASFVYQPGEVSFVDADRAMWDYNPVNAVNSRYSNSSKNASRWKFYAQASTKDYAGMIKILKDYVDERNSWITRRILTNEDNVPKTPTASYVGPEGFPLSDLTFQTTAFDSPIGAEFARMEWRIAEVTDPSAPGFDRYSRTEPRLYEINSLWESGELETFDDAITIPSHLVEPGKTYRVRVRMMDNDDHWGHWSAPVQFVANAAVSTELAESLRVSEVNYNPAAPTAAELANGFESNSDFEFIELINIGAESIDLSAAALDRVDTEQGEQGVGFSFAEGTITVLEPGQRVLVVEDLEAFNSRYGSDLPVAGQWNGRLSNNSEQITVSAFGSVIQQFTYDDEWHASTDGLGATLESVDVNATDLARWSTAAGWKASPVIGGTPGAGGIDRLPGDSNGDGNFDSSDLVVAFQSGEYEDGIAGNSTFEEGDWNQDGDFDSSDLVYVFQLGLYEVVAARSGLQLELVGAALAPTTDHREATVHVARTADGQLEMQGPIELHDQVAIDRVFDELAETSPSEDSKTLLILDEDSVLDI